LCVVLTKVFGNQEVGFLVQEGAGGRGENAVGKNKSFLKPFSSVWFDPYPSMSIVVVTFVVSFHPHIIFFLM